MYCSYLLAVEESRVFGEISKSHWRRHIHIPQSLLVLPHLGKTTLKRKLLRVDGAWAFVYSYFIAIKCMRYIDSDFFLCGVFQR